MKVQSIVAIVSLFSVAALQSSQAIAGESPAQADNAGAGLPSEDSPNLPAPTSLATEALPYEQSIPVTVAEPVPSASPEAPQPVISNIDEIVVTARGKDETLLDIPISVTAIGGAELEAQGVKALKDIAQSVPNLYMDEQATGQRISIRGVGNDTLGASFDSSTGLSIDGLYFGRSRWFEVGFFDVDQIEVLRGPQGVYFGKNTTAGLVNIRSKTPGDHPEGDLRAGYEPAFGEKFVEAAYGTPIFDTSAIRIAGQLRRSEGYIDNLDLDRKDPSSADGIGRVTYVWRPIDELTVSSKTQYAKSTRHGQTQQLLACTETYRMLLAANSGPEDCKLDDNRTEGAYVPGGFIEGDDKGELLKNVSKSQSITLDWRADDYQVTSVTGYHDQSVNFTVDPDFSDIQVGYTARPEDFRQFSEELRLQSISDGWFNYLIGAYYDDTHLDAKAIVDLNALAAAGGVAGGLLESLIPPLSNLAAVGGSAFKQQVQNNYSAAIFGEARFELTDEIELAIGGRLTKEHRKVLQTQSLGDLGNPFVKSPNSVAFFTAIQWTDLFLPEKRSSLNLSPSVIGRWKYSDDGRAYLSYVEGFKSGGFDLDIVSQTSPGAPVEGFQFDDEKVQSLELGAKQGMFDNRLRLSAAVYHAIYSDLQVQTTSGFLQVATINAKEATLDGAEVEATWMLANSWDLHAALGLSKTRYQSFENAPCFSGQSAQQGCSNDVQDLTGKRLPMAPSVSGSAGLSWHTPLFEAVQFTLGSHVNYRDSVILSVNRNPLAFTGSVTLFDLYAELADIDDRWNISVTGKNIFDERYQTGYLDVTLLAGNGGGTLGNPATILTQVKYNF